MLHIRFMERERERERERDHTANYEFVSQKTNWVKEGF